MHQCRQHLLFLTSNTSGNWAVVVRPSWHQITQFISIQASFLPAHFPLLRWCHLTIGMANFDYSANVTLRIFVGNWPVVICLLAPDHAIHINISFLPSQSSSTPPRWHLRLGMATFDNLLILDSGHNKQIHQMLYENTHSNITCALIESIYEAKSIVLS
jgi:hypothetical protein